jgi:hypothetical protein
MLMCLWLASDDWTLAVSADSSRSSMPYDAGVDRNRLTTLMGATQAGGPREASSRLGHSA